MKISSIIIYGLRCWKFNSSLLKNDSFIDRINQLWKIFLEKPENSFNLQTSWYELKSIFQGYSIYYSKNKKKQKNNYIFYLQEALYNFNLEIVLYASHSDSLE